MEIEKCVVNLNVDSNGILSIQYGAYYGEHINIDREQASQLAEVLKRYSETGRIDE